MIDDVAMKPSRNAAVQCGRLAGSVCCWVVLWLLSVWLHPLRAQDVQPVCLVAQQPLQVADTLPVLSQGIDTLQLYPVAFPAGFRQTAVNELVDTLGLLNPFWEKLQQLYAGINRDSLHIVHVGDSHIRGHVFPQTTAACMQQTFGALRYTDYGINGACCPSFTRPERLARIVSLRPDLLILSFGTNESHNRRYNSQLHYRQMDELVRLLRKSLPDVPILMTTPPGSYDSFRQRRRRRTYQVNPRTLQAVRTIHRYADSNGVAVWDMYEVFGGVKRAALNWWEAGLMRPDHVHYLPAGYELQGHMFFQALVKAYNRFITER